jgi:hypothetical protein
MMQSEIGFLFFSDMLEICQLVKLFDHNRSKVYMRISASVIVQTILKVSCMDDAKLVIVRPVVNLNC